jgi:hypothetical protein
MVAELVREACDRILVVLVKLVDVEVGGLTRARQPDTNETWLVVSEHHPVLHPRAFGLALFATGTAANAVAINRDGPVIAGAPGQALPKAPSAWEPFASAIPGEPHRGPGMARPVPARAGFGGAMPSWGLAGSLVSTRQ